MLAGQLIKKNRYTMKQERRFELYWDGHLKYFDNKSEKGSLTLTNDSHARKVGRDEVYLSVAGVKKDYVLVRKEPLKCPLKSKNFSCDLDDWLQAINFLCMTLDEQTAIK